MPTLPLGKIASAAAILDKKRILLIKRSNHTSTFPNHWTFPSGGIEETDASVFDAVIREVKEEVGLTFTPVRKWSYYESIANGKRYISCVHLGEWSGEIRLQESEASEYRFFAYIETKKLSLAFAYKEVIDDLHAAGLIE